MSHAILNTLNRQQLADLYNAHAAKPLGLASTKPVAVSRVEALCKSLGLEPFMTDAGPVLRKPEPAPKPQVVKPAPKAPVHGLAARRGPKPTYDDTHVITILAKANPKRAKSDSAARFALYRDGMTVGEYLAAAHKLQPGSNPGRWRCDLSFDTERDYIRIDSKVGL
jgi:hypothetical protein